MSRTIVLAALEKNFDQVECTGCHRFVMSNSPELPRWMFSLRGLAPSIIKVAKGLCASCQETQVLFGRILERVGQ